MYLGRGIVTQEVTGHSSRVGAITTELYILTVDLIVVLVVRTVSTGKVMAIFSEVGDILLFNDPPHFAPKGSDIQAEKRGNFVVIGCVEASRVVSWSLNVRCIVATIRICIGTLYLLGHE